MIEAVNEISPVKRSRGMTAVTLPLAAGVPQRLNISGDYFHTLTAPSGDLIVKFDDAKTMPAFASVGVRVYYDTIELSSAGGQTVTVLVGFGSVFDGRRTSDAEFPAANDAPATARVTCTAGARTQIIAADGSRNELRVTNPSDSAGSVYLGDVAVSATVHGGLLEPGVTDYMPASNALYVWNPNATDVTVYVLPLRRV